MTFLSKFRDRCLDKSVAHLTVCTSSCAVGYHLANGEELWTLICENGLWSDVEVSCVQPCQPPFVVSHASVSCDAKVCFLLIFMWHMACFKYVLLSMLP